MKISHGALVLVADGRKSLLFRNEGDEKYPVLETIEHAQIDNPPARAQGTDRPGRSFASTGKRRTAYIQPDRHRMAEERFATETARRLEHVAASLDGSVVIIAPPAFLGELRHQLDGSLAQRISAAIPKDLSHHTTDDIVEAIASYPVGD